MLHSQRVSHVFQIVDAIHLADEIILIQFQLVFAVDVDLDVVAFERCLAVCGRPYVEFAKVSFLRTTAKQDLDFSRSVFAAFGVISLPCAAQIERKCFIRRQVKQVFSMVRQFSSASQEP